MTWIPDLLFSMLFRRIGGDRAIQLILTAAWKVIVFVARSFVDLALRLIPPAPIRPAPPAFGDERYRGLSLRRSRKHAAAGQQNV
ncbi:hypothetical protein HB777_15150 [Mesorhizobium loti]|nr:hypothetical protein HB777_15150 [Mesorhizobium loti]